MAGVRDDWEDVVRTAVVEALSLGHARVPGHVARASISERCARDYLESFGAEDAVAYEIVGDTLRLMRTADWRPGEAEAVA
jgi:hypothetical protein